MGRNFGPANTQSERRKQVDPNSGKIYRDPTEAQIKDLGLVEVSEDVAEMVEIGRRVIQRRKSQSKSVRRAKNSMARKTKQRQRA